MKCDADLAADDRRTSGSQLVLDAQRAILRTVSTGVANFGLYADDPQPAVFVLEDIRVLARISRSVLRTDPTLIATAVLGTDLAEQFESMKASKAERTLAHPRSAVLAAVGNASAYLALSEPDRIGALLADRMSSSATTGRYSRQFAREIDRSLGRRRRPTTTLRSLSVLLVGDPVERARKVPALLWPDWTARLAPNRLDQEVAASALAATVVLAGSDLTHGAALALLDPQLSGRRVTHLMMTLGDSRAEEQTLQDICKLADFLDRSAVPIDYGRRRSLDYTALLPETEWIAICKDTGVLPGSGRRWRSARLGLFMLLTGSGPAAAPPQLLAPSASERADASKFLRSAPQKVRVRVEHVGHDFLTAQHIDEPLTWTPTTEVLGPQSPVETAPVPEKADWPAARPAIERLHANAGDGTLVSAYNSGSSAEILASEFRVGKQTVLRALESAHAPRRRAGRVPRMNVDDDWLRHRYLVEMATTLEIATELGCSNQSVSRFLKRAAIPTRPRGSGSRAEHLRPHPAAGDSLLLQKTLIGQDALERARRFLVVAEQPNLSSAAHVLEVTASVVIHQMTLLERAVGGALLVRAQHGQAQKLTPLGRKLRRELIRSLEEHQDQWSDA